RRIISSVWPTANLVRRAARSERSSKSSSAWRLILQRYSIGRQLHKLSSVQLLRRRITMTPEQVAALGPAFAAYLRHFEDCFVQDRTREHLQTYCRGLLSDLPRKSVEPIAVAAG